MHSTIAQTLKDRIFQPSDTSEMAGLYRSVFESMNQGFCIFQVLFDEHKRPMDYLFLETNPAFETHTGMKSVVGKRMRDLAPNHEQHWFDIYGKIALTGEPLRFVQEATQLDNRWFDLDAFRVGQPEERKVAVIFNDITERRRAETALRFTEAQRFALIEQSPIGMYLIDSEFRLLQINPKARPVFPNIEVTLGHDFRETMRTMWPSETSEEILARFQHTLQTGEPYFVHGFTKGRADTGKKEFYDWEIHRVTLPDGQYGVVCYFIDISDYVKAQQKIQESERRVRLVTDNAPLLISYMDSGMVHRFGNAVYRDWFGRDSANVSATELLGEEIYRHREPYLRKALAGEQLRFQGPMYRRGFGPRDAEITLVPDKEENGTICGVYIFVSDITERKRAEEEMSRIRDELAQKNLELEHRVEERTAKLRDTIGELEHFSYTITHDMRAPLRAMQAFGQILRDEYNSRLDEAGRDYLRRIVDAASRMDNLITDALNYSKVVRDEIPLEPIDPGALVRGIIESYPQFLPPQAGVELEGDFPFVLANKAGLTQCISNLLGNAVKFVEPGKLPNVRVWAEPRGDVARIWFEDNGIGIDPRQQQRVFVMFQRLNKQYEGTGVGLALVRKVVERMKGKVGFESEPGKGSRFWLELEKVSH
jgi:PAS domain S-box-containing protein